MADNATLVRSLYDGWNARDFDALADAMAPDGTITFMGSGEVLRARRAPARYNEMWADGFPDGQVTVDTLVADGDRVVVEYTGRGTHTGTFVTSMGDDPADRQVGDPEAVRRRRGGGRQGHGPAQLPRHRIHDGAARTRLRADRHRQPVGPAPTGTCPPPPSLGRRFGHGPSAPVDSPPVALTIGIVGLPNAGKSTLFNALTKNDVLAANYPFATIEPNVGVVGVPEPRLGEARRGLRRRPSSCPRPSSSSTSPASSAARPRGRGWATSSSRTSASPRRSARSPGSSATRTSRTSTARSTPPTTSPPSRPR